MRFVRASSAGAKTPLHVWHMDEIATVFDDSALVAVVRHPVASIATLVDRFGMSVADATTTWLEMNRVLVHDGARLGGRFVLTRYEDLVTEPEPVLRELLDWLGEPWSPSLLEHDRLRSASETALSDTDHASVRRRTESWGRFFGYDVDESAPVERLVPKSAPRRYFLTGEQLAQRREAFAVRSNWRPKRPSARGSSGRRRGSTPRGTRSPSGSRSSSGRGPSHAAPALSPSRRVSDARPDHDKARGDGGRNT